MPDFLHANVADRERLVSFVPFVRDLLAEVVEGRLVHENLRSPLRGAWREIEQRGDFPKLEAAAREAPSGKIIDHGLSGGQLELKRRVIERWWERYTQRPIARLLRRLLDAIDNLLDSLIEAVGVGGAIKEFKQAVANALEEEET